MTRNQHDLSERDLRSLLPVAYLLPGTDGEKPWPGESGRRRLSNQTLTRPGVIAVVAGVVMTLMLVVSFYAFANPRDRFRPQAMTLLSGTPAAPEAQGVILSDSTAMLLFAHQLPEPAPGFRYVLWHISRESVESLGQLRTSGNGSAHLRTDQARFGTSFRVTLEAAGSVDQPTGPVILRTDDP
jgi:anti-sigma-K factor RskA